MHALSRCAHACIPSAHPLCPHAQLASGPLLAESYAYPISCEFGTDNTQSGKLLDPRLLSGSLLFGIGWGALGICPGPSVVGLAIPLLDGGGSGGEGWRFPVFVLASLVGMELVEVGLPPAPFPASAGHSSML